MDNEKIYYVYEWIRLDTNEPFYVGKGKGYRSNRIKRGHNKHFNNIVKSIPVAVHILHDALTEQEALEYECWYIYDYRYNWGYDLTNLTDGGEGISGYTPSEQELKRNRMKTHGFDIEDYKDCIIDMYINKNMSTVEISKYYGVSNVCIARVLRKFGINLRTCGETLSLKEIGLKRYNSKCILVKNTNQKIVNCFESLSLCGKWLSEIGLVNHPNGGKKAIRTNINTNINYKGLLFYFINKDEYRNIMLRKDEFVEFKVNHINTQSMAHSKVIEVYDNNFELINTYSSLFECINWLLSINLSNSFSAARDAIYRSNNNGKFYKKKYKFIIYSKSEYNKKINKIAN